MVTSPETAAAPPAFEVRLENFTGPFDLLLSLIAAHKMDVTEVALAVVTDDFIAYIRAQESWDLSQASEFLVVGATLLDLKAARLLPRGEVEEAEDLELLEARDLLFARLLQYRAFKQAAGDLQERFERADQRFGRDVPLEPHLAALLPELVMQVGPEDLARRAAAALAPRPVPPGVDLHHLHAPVVSVAEQAAQITDLLRRLRHASFRALTEDAETTTMVVARFLALLELYRQGAVGFDQAGPLGDLTVHWTGEESGEVTISDDFDEEAPAAGTGQGTTETDRDSIETDTDSTETGTDSTETGTDSTETDTDTTAGQAEEDGQ